jgi:ABC-2 type transport system ATP-binding protein
MNAIEITNLTKTYSGGVVALKNINLIVKEGDFFALLGANGAGKTTIIGILTSLVNKTSGEVRVFDYDLITQTNDVKAQIGVVPQEFNFNIFEKVEDIIIQQAGFYGMARKEAVIRTEFLLKKLELWDKRNTISQKLSGGMKRRLMIARALVHNPRLLILDEPTAGVDVELRLGMWEFLKQLNIEGTTILLTTHYLEEVEQLCKNAAMIREGEIVANNSVHALLKSVSEQTYKIETESIPKNFTLKGYKVEAVSGDTIEVTIDTKKQSLNTLIKEITSHKIEITSISPKDNRLEKLFINHTKN